MGQGKFRAVQLLNNSAYGQDGNQDDDQNRDDMTDRFPGAKILNCINKFHDRIAVFLVQLAEFLHRATGIALGIAMPHDGLDDGLGATVVQTVTASGADG